MVHLLATGLSVVLILCYATFSIHVIERGTCRVFYRRDGSDGFLTLPAGVRVCNPVDWAPLAPGLWKGLAPAIPVPGTAIDIHPQQFNVRVADKPIRLVDIIVECTVLNWSAEDILKIQYVSIAARAKAVVQYWAASVPMDGISISGLNKPAALAQLNMELAPLFLVANRVVAGPSGIGPSLQDYNDEAEIARIKKIGAAKAEVYALKVKSLIEAGLPPADVYYMLREKKGP